MKLSNYIMEQDINDVSVMDIYSEQALAEFNVASALADAYIKQTMMLEYAANIEDVSEDFIQEATDGTKKKFPNVFKIVGKAIVSAVMFVVRKIQEFFTKIKLKFTKNRLEKAVKEGEKTGDEFLIPVREETLEKCMNAYMNFRACVLNIDKGNVPYEPSTIHPGNTSVGKQNLIELLDVYTRWAKNPNDYIGDNSVTEVDKLCESIRNKIKMIEQFDLQNLIKKDNEDYKKALEKAKSHAEYEAERKAKAVEVEDSLRKLDKNPKMDEITPEFFINAMLKKSQTDTATAESFATAQAALNFVKLLEKDAATINSVTKIINDRVKSIQKQLDSDAMTASATGELTPTEYRAAGVDKYGIEMKAIADVSKEFVNATIKLMNNLSKIFGVDLTVKGVDTDALTKNDLYDNRTMTLKY